MDPFRLDLFLGVVQTASLVVLAIYTWKTCTIAGETKRSAAAQEETLKLMSADYSRRVSPNVIVYFDVDFNQSVIYLVVRNVGLGAASHIDFRIDPPLRSHSLRDIRPFGFIQHGIAQLLPGQEIRTTFDSAIRDYDETSDVPVTYDVEVTYYADFDIQKRTSIHKLDLKPYAQTIYTNQKDIPQIVDSLSKLVDEQKKAAKATSDLAERMRRGVRVTNPRFTVLNLGGAPNDGLNRLEAHLREFCTYWMALTEVEHPGSSRLIDEGVLGYLSVYACDMLACLSTSQGFPKTVTGRVLSLAGSINRLSSTRLQYAIDKDLIVRGTELANEAKAILKLIESNSNRSTRSCKRRKRPSLCTRYASMQNAT